MCYSAFVRFLFVLHRCDISSAYLRQGVKVRTPNSNRTAYAARYSLLIRNRYAPSQTACYKYKPGA